MTPQTNSKDFAKQLRLTVLEMIHRARSSHIGGCYSLADILSVLYCDIMRYDPAKPDWAERDRYIQSKGHAAAALYGTLALKGFFPKEWLDEFCANGAKLGGHVSSHQAPGVEVSTGGLGHGLAIGVGMALAAKRENSPARVYVAQSDGELDEGSVWEAALFAAHHGLSNLTTIIDYNKIQSFGRVDEVIRLDPLADKWRAFGWAVQEIDGHDHDAIRTALKSIDADKPNCIVANTVKGKGVSFMEDKLIWHYRPPSDDELKQARAELEAA